MSNIKIKKLLTASVSGFVIAACMGDASLAANVGSSTTNATVATGAGALFIFDTANGTLTNTSAGTISATSGNAVVATAVSGGTITNAGTISTADTSLAAISVSKATTINNSGTISGVAKGITVASGAAGSIINNTGTITITGTTAGNAAIDIAANTAITNSGQITATGAANAIRVATAVSAAGTTIDNQVGGVIQVTGTGSAIIVGSPITSINNAGTIQSTAGTAIEVTANGSITSGITNTATGSIIGGGGNAIDASSSANPLTVNNAGTITGNIRLGSGANVVNVSGGSISGQIFGANPTVVNYTGDTTANGIVGVGTVNHSAGVLTVASGITAANVNNTGGTIAITSNKTITGNYTQTAGGTFQTAVTGRTTAAVLTVTGTATLADSSTIKAQIADGINLQAADSFTVLSAGALTATPANLTVTDNDPFIILTASKVANTLVLTASAASDSQAQSSILSGAGFTSTGNGTGGLGASVGGSNGGTNVGNTFNAYTGYLSYLRTNDFTTFNAVNSVFGGLTGTAFARGIQNLAVAAPVATGTAQGVTAGSNTSGGVVLSRLDTMRNAEAGMSAGDKYSRNAKAWFQPYGSALTQDKKDGVDGYDANTYGVLLGGDVNILDNTRAGIAIGYNHTKVDANQLSSGSGAGTDGYEAKVYGSHTIGNYFVDGLLGAQFNQNDVHRFSSAFGDTARASYDSWLYNANVKAGYNFKQASGLTLTPSAGFNYSYLDADGYSEHGSVINNKVNSSNYTGATSELGLKAAYPIKRTTGTLTPEVRASWLHEFGDSQFSNTSSFIGSGSSYTTKGAKIDEDAGRFGVGLGFQTLGNTTISGDVDYIGRDSSDAVAGKLNVKIPF